MNRFKADLALLLAALIWGTAFVAQKTANASMPPILFVGCRFTLSALMLAPLAWAETRRRGALPAARDWRLGALVGLCLFGSVTLQQIGMLTTTATNAGFLTALYVAMVPAVMWIASRHRPSLAVAAACAVSLAGAWLLAGRGGGSGWNGGDLIVLVSDIFFAVQIILVPRFLARGDRPLLLSFLQYAVSGIGGFALSLAFEPFDLAGIAAAAPAILYAGLLSGGVAFTLQIVAQRHTPAAEAAIIMSLESVFAALAGAWLLGDRLSGRGIAGCALILAGVLLVQLAPLWRRNPLAAAESSPQDASPETDRG
jgi:drug/metabolite transporter (DMT)-like permease